jgi:hypothetical protein
VQNQLDDIKQFLSGSTLNCLNYGIGNEEVVAPSNLRDIKLFPNPISPSQILQIQHTGQKIDKIRIINTEGKIVQLREVNGTQGRTKMHLSAGLSSGVYNIQISFSDGAVITKKLLISK